ncbi:MAG: 2-oxoglutarate ferredoxin oxidoreductase subunit alpha, partial [Calditrichaeota bacterium]|nr:2-oxoglutarate ferredoxin oxidoreductase subunit alpha [Calditrichota bacterium]
KTKPVIKEANILALRGGYAYCDATETTLAPTLVKPAKLASGKYRSITGNLAVAMGLVAASEKSGMGVFYSGYPITPASEILHEMFRYENFNIKIFQAEDEIAAIGAALGASYTGKIGVTASSGPGIALKSETMSLAVMTELPLVIIDVQRSGPSTGMPTKTEQADLNMAIFGRHGESSVPVIAASRPADCFATIYEATRISVKYRIPVIFLSDGYIANGSEPWPLPDPDKLPEISANFETNPDSYEPYARDGETLARKWATPGTAGFEHRIGGLEKSDLSGDVSYDPDNHHKMTLLRNEKLERIKNDMLDLYQDGEDSGDILLIGWGSTYGAIRTAVEMFRKEKNGKRITHIHLKWLNPLNKQVDHIIRNFNHVLVPEINLGQLRRILRARFLIDIHGFNLVRGLPFTATEIFNEIKKYV